MKSTFKKPLNRVIALAAIVSVIVLSSFTSLFANDNSKKASDAYSISYAGTTNAGIVFNLKFENPTASKFNVVLKNDAGEVLFQQEYKDKNFDGNIVLAKEEGDGHITFAIVSSAAKYTENFTIKTITKTVDEVVVKNN